MISGQQIVQTVSDWGTTHVVWLPDSMLGTWEESLDAANSFELIRVCREGESWPLAAGLQISGKSNGCIPTVRNQIYIILTGSISN